MLSLTRKNGEKIMIGEDIEILITNISVNQVRISIKAPDDVTIHREEIWNKIKNRKKEKNYNN